MQSFNQLKKNLKKDFSNFKTKKIAVLGDTATQFLVQAMRGAGYEYAYDLQIWEADFSQIENQIFDENSELYKFGPEVVMIFYSSHKLLGKYNKLKPEQYTSLADDQLSVIKGLNATIRSRSSSKIIMFNYAEINDSIFGSYANKTESSFLFQLRKLNYELMSYASQTPDFYLLDMSSIQNQLGKSAVFQPSVYINTDMVLSLDVLPEISAKILDLILAMSGKFKKCLILDLDNTMWGGIIGDDGLENIQIGNFGIGKAFTEFQYWAKKLQQRGIILAVCSKNTESVAKEPFQKHPDMVLRLEDIAVFVANWENKVNNIRKIQEVLNIGFDSMVFLDDNPFERNIVRENIAGITVPELPEDPADYLECLYQLNLFETVTFSGQDAERTKQYQVEAERMSVQKSFVNENDFLKSLDMKSLVSDFNKFNTPRVAELSNRSNQFNLRTIRYSEMDIQRLADSEDFFTFAFTLEDKFGDNGLICIIILKKESGDALFIDSWFMSCRVLKRSMENFVTNTIVNFAKENGFRFLKGEYIATEKNGMVKDHYMNLGFKEERGYWMLDTESYKNKDCFISKK